MFNNVGMFGFGVLVVEFLVDVWCEVMVINFDVVFYVVCV